MFSFLEVHVIEICPTYYIIISFNSTTQQDRYCPYVTDDKDIEAYISKVTYLENGRTEKQIQKFEFILNSET